MSRCEEYRWLWPKSVQPAGKSNLREIWNTPDRETAEAAIATFADKYGTKYDRPVTCLVRDRDRC